MLLSKKAKSVCVSDVLCLQLDSNGEAIPEICALCFIRASKHSKQSNQSAFGLVLSCAFPQKLQNVEMQISVPSFALHISIPLLDFKTHVNPINSISKLVP